jgi:hypothetical protein
MTINYQKVMEKMGWIAEDITSYNTIRQTWNEEESGRRCPSRIIFSDIWRDMVFSGEETGDWKQERQKLYQSEKIFINQINDLVMEYNLALANGDTATANKYKSELSSLQDKRKVIKQQFPKN